MPRRPFKSRKIPRVSDSEDHSDPRPSPSQGLLPCIPAGEPAWLAPPAPSSILASCLPLCPHTEQELCMGNMGCQFCLELLLLLRCKDPREVRRHSVCILGLWIVPLARSRGRVMPVWCERLLEVTVLQQEGDTVQKKRRNRTGTILFTQCPLALASPTNPKFRNFGWQLRCLSLLPHKRVWSLQARLTGMQCHCQDHLYFAENWKKIVRKIYHFFCTCLSGYFLTIWNLIMFDFKVPVGS